MFNMDLKKKKKNDFKLIINSNNMASYAIAIKGAFINLAMVTSLELFTFFREFTIINKVAIYSFFLFFFFFF